MLAFLGTGVGKFLLGLLMPVILGGVKQGIGSAWDKIPKWLQPLITSILGAAAGAVATLSTGATDLESIAAGAAAGAAGGASGKALRDSKKEIMVA